MHTSFSKVTVREALEHFSDFSEKQTDVLQNARDIFIAESEDTLFQLEDGLAQNGNCYLVTLELEDLSSRETLISRIYQTVFEDASDQLNLSQQIEAIEQEFPQGQKCILSLIDFDDCHSRAQENFLSLAVVSKSFGLLLYSEKSIDAGEESLQRLWRVLAKRVACVGADEIFTDENMDETSFLDEEDMEQDNANRNKLWYQLVPKYHLAGGLILFLIVIALWNMDLSGEKQQTIELVESQSDTFVKPINEDVQKVAIEEPIETIETKQADIIPEEIIETIEPVEQKPVSKLPVINKPESGKVDWSPYQSEQWIKKQNPKAYTLQILASHNEQGVRDFFHEQGISSQYAVFTTQKDNKPWHIVIYGIYETHEQADRARHTLPDYLKNLSPWIRPFSAIQQSLN